ncbi:hypothetical protein [Nocardioides sp.]|uniref:hypothetical protein n=1 Tax=Nocardioides sp. TaxID=35761 RepID=UPI002B269602|nr:hypothetical protein [Nocardioides sp.]
MGSVGEEAAKLFGALSDWAKDSGPTAGLGAGFGESITEGLSGFADQAAATVADLNAHLATGSAECTYCPVCRTVHAVRQTSPEVKAHLVGAASSFLQAMTGLLATLPPPASGNQSGAGVERIDLDDPEDPDDLEDLDDTDDPDDPDTTEDEHR